MNAGAIIVAQQRQAVRTFRERGCTRPEKARPLEELAVRRNFAIRALISNGVLHEVESQRYWLDESAWERLCTRRRKLVMWLLLLGAVTVTILLLMET